MAFVVSTTVGMWLAWPRERLLMKVARPIARVDTGKQELCWLSAHQLLIVTTDEEPGYTAGRNGSLATAPWQGSADVLDITTHTKTRLVALTNLFKRISSPNWGRGGGFEISPDGPWLLWETYHQHGASPPCRHVARLDGTHYREWNPETGYYGEKFFLDSAHLVQMKGMDKPCMMICDLQNPRNDREYRKQEQAKTVLGQYFVRQPFFLEVAGPYNNPSQGVAKIDAFRTVDRIQTLFGSFFDDEATRVRNAPKPLRTCEVALPAGATLSDAEVSPQQQSILYDLQISRSSPLLSWLHRLLPHFSTEPIAREGLWVSRSDGRGMRDIGSVPKPLATPDRAEPQLEHLQWLPDGKQISFFYHGMLYVAPAEPGT